MFTITQQLKYIFNDLEMPFGFKILYFLEKVIKFPFLKLNEYFGLKLKLPYLFKSDYLLKNNDGIWAIKYASDFDYIINPYFEHELRPYFQLHSGIFIDIGAHIGKRSVYVAKQNSANVIHSIEGNIETFGYLNKNIKGNKLKNINTYNFAVTDQDGPIEFECNTEYQGVSKIANSRYQVGGKKIYREVQGYTIESFLEKYKINQNDIKLIKIDVEGFELQVLKGFGLLLGKLHKEVKIICEINHYQENKQEIIDYMCQRGFNVTTLPSQCDYMFSYK